MILHHLGTWSQEEYSKLQEQMRKMKEDHERVIQEELLKMERELQEEQVGADAIISGVAFKLLKKVHLVQNSNISWSHELCS